IRVSSSRFLQITLSDGGAQCLSIRLGWVVQVPILTPRRRNRQQPVKNQMKPSDISTFEELVTYLREFVNLGGVPVDYDFVGAFTLFSAILGNLSEHHLDADLDSLKETGYTISDAECRFLEKFLEQFGSNR